MTDDFFLDRGDYVVLSPRGEPSLIPVPLKE
jgi:hypothetical protein